MSDSETGAKPAAFVRESTGLVKNVSLFDSIAMNYGHEISERELVAFQDKITGRDVPVVESQRPERLPLDLQAEPHLRSDRVAVAYRRWLGELGVSFGTA